EHLRAPQLEDEGTVRAALVDGHTLRELDVNAAAAAGKKAKTRKCGHRRARSRTHLPLSTRALLRLLAAFGRRSAGFFAGGNRIWRAGNGEPLPRRRRRLRRLSEGERRLHERASAAPGP